MNTRISSSAFVESVIEAIKSVIGDSPQSLHEPRFIGKEKEYLLDCISTGVVSSIGSYVDSFEQELVEFTGAKHAIAVVNGTAALHISLLLAGVQAGDEVLIPSLTFVATANAVSYCGGVAHFVDSEESTLGIDVSKLRKYLEENTRIHKEALINKKTNARIRAIVPMHCFGHPSDIQGLIELATDFKLILVEDAAESLGSTYLGRHTGTFGLTGAISFNGNKIITTGGGGAVLTDDDEIAKRGRHISKTARIPHKLNFIHDEIGYNYRMPNINAALGLAQIEGIETEIKNKRSLAANYREVFKQIEGLKFLDESRKSRSNYWLQTIILSEQLAFLRDEILLETNAVGISTRPAWNLISELKPYRTNPSMELSGSKNLVKRILNLPSSAKLGEFLSHE